MPVVPNVFRDLAPEFRLLGQEVQGFLPEVLKNAQQVGAYGGKEAWHYELGQPDFNSHQRQNQQVFGAPQPPVSSNMLALALALKAYALPNAVYRASNN